MKIMFICTGNICRSAMAHKLFEKKLQDNNITDVTVYSSGIFAYNGDMATFDACDAMEEYGVDMSSHKATNTRNSNINEMDLILCATLSHKNSLINMYPELRDKIYTIKEYVGNSKDDLDISDPWGYDISVYRRCASQIDTCLDKLISMI